ncbi:unnamed protein product, partial [Prorocentrum cordatum]
PPAERTPPAHCILKETVAWTELQPAALKHGGPQRLGAVTGTKVPSIRAAPRAARERAHGPPTIDGFKIALKTKNGRGPPERNGGREGRSSDAGGVGSGGAGAAVALLPRKDSPHTPGAISRSLGDEAAVRSSGGTRA